MLHTSGSERATGAQASVPPHDSNGQPGGTTLHSLLTDVANAVVGTLAHRDRRVAAALIPYLGLPDLLPDSARRCSPDRYTRHLLHAGADYTILSLVWRPRQMSPVHTHRTWCVFGLHQGWLVETRFFPSPEGIKLGDCIQRHPGQVVHSPEDPNTAHRLANVGAETAFSIHVYGAPFDRLGEAVNRIWAD